MTAALSSRRVPFFVRLVSVSWELVSSAVWADNDLTVLLAGPPDQPTTLADLTPKFNTTPEHVTVKAGEKAILPCSVEYIGDSTVIWVSPRTQLISHADRRMIDDQRITIERPYVKEWNLHINDVRYNDSGTYLCQINTIPVQGKKVSLSVLVPPAIISRLSSDNIRLREGETAELVCNVTGVPHPNVTWNKRNYRQGRGHKERIGLEGELLLIHNVTRYCDDIYECFVENGVPPSVSKAIRVIVEFAPEVIVTTKRIGQRRGRETILECKIYAHPQGWACWKRNGVQIHDDEKFLTEAYPETENRIVILSLRINKLAKEDFGTYVCEGSNYLGTDKEEMILYEIEPIATTPVTTTTTRGQRYEILTNEEKEEGLILPEVFQRKTSTNMYPMWPPIENNNDNYDEHEEKGLVLGLNNKSSSHKTGPERSVLLSSLVLAVIGLVKS